MNNSTPNLPIPKFENPYDNSKLPPGEARSRTTIDIFARVHAFIDGVHGRKGTLQTTLNILLNKTVKELKHHGIDDYNPNGYEIALAGCIIVLGGTTEHAAVNDLLTSLRAGPSVDPGVPAGGAERLANAAPAVPNDGQPAPSVAREAVGEHILSPDASGNRPRRRRSRKGGE